MSNLTYLMLCNHSYGTKRKLVSDCTYAKGKQRNLFRYVNCCRVCGKVVTKRLTLPQRYEILKKLKNHEKSLK